MKKRFIIAASILSLSLLVGCGGRPSDMDEATYNVGKQALSIEEQYLNGAIDKREALDQISALSDDINEAYYNLEDLHEQIRNVDVSNAILSFRIGIDSPGKVKDSYNKLKNALGS